LAKGSHIKIIDRQMVSKSGALLIVEIEGTQYVVGATEQTVQIMLKLDTPIPYQPIPEVQAGSFKSLLKQFIKKDGNHEQHL
ncbi:MAG: flagellar biosynthetic protein FliO, partial [Eubacteriales bacterium]|nr:flagellar biosynthetic protein FliO [Eubacteriales bacterium]